MALDLRGYGASPDPAPDFSPANLTADVVSVLDAAGVDRAVLVCQSLGGWAGLRTAVEAPERVRGLVLCNTMAGVAHMPALQALGQAAASVNGNIPSLALTPEFVANRPEMAHLYRSVGVGNRPNDPEIAKRFTGSGLLPPERLSDVACPTLMIAGENDPIWPPASIQLIAAQIPNSRFEVIAGAGHSPYFETPETFNETVMDFISSIG
ncbi:alpha/beta fold hydrolase [Sulfitobacter aestuariivivens]|uniref:alpha/beta fold hydrolase n=1 Tax=Sulfitobacter aestuariivivens TaxID=2766981 RepID=UPI00361A5A6C